MATESQSKWIELNEDASPQTADDVCDEVDAVFTVIDKGAIPDKFLVRQGTVTREKSSSYHTVSTNFLYYRPTLFPSSVLL